MNNQSNPNSGNHSPKARNVRWDRLIFGATLLIGVPTFGIVAWNKGWLERKPGPEASLPPAMDIPTATAEPTATATVATAAGNTLYAPPPDVPVTLPSTVVGCKNAFPIRWQGYAWNAQLGCFVGNGGPESTEGSLMCQNGIHLTFARHDDNGLLTQALVDFATAYSKGQDNPSVGAHFVTLMGDGYPAFVYAANQMLAKLGPDYRLEVIGAVGKSAGEDACLGPQKWRDNPQTMRGALIITVLKDGDQMVCIHKAKDANIPVNADPATYNPDAMNFINAAGYIEAVQDLAAHRCVDLVNTKTHQKENHCADGAGTWTPGDVMAMEKIPGLVKVASTHDYPNQMASVVIGVRPWMSAHRAQTVKFLDAAFKGGHLVKTSLQALRRGSEISDKAYVQPDTGAAYWEKYFLGTVGPVSLGGSQVFDLADNVAYFGLQQGVGSAYKPTYEMIGRVVTHYYPADVPSVPKYEDAVNLSYLKELMKSTPTAAATVQAATYADVSASPTKAEFVRRNWSITFDTGKSVFTPAAEATLNELLASVVGAQDMAVEIHGHTDNQGSPDSNKVLSEQRAFAVETWLNSKDPARCPASRFRVTAHGQDNPLKPNDTAENRAENRRVEVVFLSK